MNIFISILGGALAGIIIGGIVGYFIGKPYWIKIGIRQGKLHKSGTFVNDAEKLKSENIAKLRDYINGIKATPLDSPASNGAGINNGDVRTLLNVSDTTPIRYLINQCFTYTY